MKNKIIFIFTILLLLACNPRVDMDFKQWGDHAYIDNLEVVKLDVEKQKLQEYYEAQTPIEVTGVRNIVISEGETKIDSIQNIAKIKIKQGESIDRVSLRIYHKSVQISPYNGSPKLGILADYSKREFSYKLKSADGTERIWTVILEQ